MSIYKRLFKYRERAARAPREDFLSEALVDLLSRMTRNEALAAINELFIRDNHIQQKWDTHLRNTSYAEFVWDTQKIVNLRGNQGRLDIILTNDRREVLLIIENKISARFQKHRTQQKDADMSEFQNQLASYGHWLA